MIHEIFPVGPLQCNCSIVGDEQTREAMVIDPGDNIDEVLAIVQRHALTVKQIVITHAHIDHIGGAAKLKTHHRRARSAQRQRSGAAEDVGCAGDMAGNEAARENHD